jgi:AraC family transcriptional regulator
MKPKIVERPAFRVVGTTGRFTPATASQISALWGRFAPRMGEVPGRTEPRVSYGVCAPDESAGTEPGFYYTASVAVDAMSKPPAGMVAIDLPAARYAVVTHTGPIAAIGATWDSAHRVWIPEAGLRVTGEAGFERYDERWDPRTVSGPVDIFIPVARA